MAITVHISEPKKDKIYINLPDGEMEHEVTKAIEKILDDAMPEDKIDPAYLVEKAFDAMEKYGVIVEW